VHIDRTFRDSSFRINRRDEKSGMAVDKEEIEANFFAAELLMPLRMIERDLEAFDVDVEDEAELSELAKRYQVSLQALIHRVNNVLRHA
jgi:Zn-dependent peptidase ImmA (M78 family)